LSGWYEDTSRYAVKYGLTYIANLPDAVAPPT
jgi:hypothetical protein